jgi:glutathione S-transferase
VSTAGSARLRLHGYPVSNYFNIARAALIEKRADFEVVIARASREPAFMTASPMGKIPFLETPAGWIAETVAILEYIEDTVPGPALYPADAFLRARARQIMNVVQMYVEAPVRSLFPGVFLGQSNSESAIDTVRQTLDRSSAALRNLIFKNGPYLVGTALSYADLFTFYCLDIADRVTRYVYHRSFLEDVGGLKPWCQTMASRASTRAVFADFYPAFTGYLTHHSARYDCAVDIDVLVPPAVVEA